jgi:hypothetical protein
MARSGLAVRLTNARIYRQHARRFSRGGYSLFGAHSPLVRGPTHSETCHCHSCGRNVSLRVSSSSLSLPVLRTHSFAMRLAAYSAMRCKSLDPASLCESPNAARTHLAAPYPSLHPDGLSAILATVTIGLNTLRRESCATVARSVRAVSRAPVGRSQSQQCTHASCR